MKVEELSEKRTSKDLSLSVTAHLALFAQRVKLFCSSTYMIQASIHLVLVYLDIKFKTWISRLLLPLVSVEATPLSFVESSRSILLSLHFRLDVSHLFP